MKNAAAIFVLLILAFSNSFAQTDNELPIRQMEKKWLIESYKTGDMTDFNRIVADDFRITHSNGKVLTKTEKHADIVKNQIKNPALEDVFQIDEASVRVTFHGPDAAVSKGYIIENYLWNGKRHLDHVHFTNTYLKRNGSWQVVSSHLTRLNQKPPADQNGREVTFRSKDGVTLYGDIYESSKGKSAPLIILFHQGGGDARGEYSPIIPKLLELGYNVFAADTRQGGKRFGTNRTMVALENKKFTYCDAYQDLETALRYANDQGFTGKKIVWGSSFSATLVMRLGADHGKDVAGVLAFSPASGPPMGDCQPTDYSGNLKIPALLLRPRSEMESERAQNQFALFKQQGHQTYVAENGVHGSSMLVESRIEGSAEPHWKAVLEFIRKTFEQ